ncbi:enhancin [Parapoynx stagnalis nucleopolyhedrovirus]|uniref:Enhancin n=1 Tax=Parapoynx stagnalis nucleopolyhedrovirus TaxID=2993413 RepID=A0A9E8BWE0_9ABAC|nr:enhancin [Parapoynx stagnalis nucleopolyhedrovirus]
MFSIEVPTTFVPDWIAKDQSFSFLAVNHNRIDCSIFVKAGDTITINNVSTDNVHFRIYNDSMIKEYSTLLNVADGKVSHVVQHDGVPFFDCQLNGMDYSAEIEIDTIRPLPKYVYGTDSHLVWNDYEPFALLISNYVQILVPFVDRDIVLNSNIDSILEWYEDVITFFDNLVGLTNEYLHVNQVNANSNKRFFVKANIITLGINYYDRYHIAQGTESVALFLNPVPTNWEGLREIAHAYDFHFIRSGPVPLLRVWNTILCDSYQNLYLTRDEKSVNSPSALSVGQTIVNKIKNLESVNVFSDNEKLAIFSYIMDIDPQVFAKINESWRYWRLGNVIGNEYFLPNEFALPMQMWWLMYSQFDIRPIFESILMPCDDWMINEDNRLNSKPAMIFCGMFDDDFDVPLQLKSIDENPKNTTDVIIDIDIKDFNQIANQMLRLRVGNRIAYSFTITSVTFSIHVICGIYKIDMPRGYEQKTYKIVTSDHENYLLAHKNYTRQCRIKYYEQNEYSYLQNEFGRFYGFNDSNVGTMQVDYLSNILNITNVNPDPNSGYLNNMYIRFALQNKIILDITGVNMQFKIQTNNFNVGDTLIIRHLQGNLNRMNFMSQITTQMEYTITFKGVKVFNDFIENVENNLLNKIDKCAKYFENNLLYITNDNLFWDSIYSAILQFDTQKHYLLKKYDKFLPLRFRIRQQQTINIMLICVIISAIILFIIIFIIFIIVYKKSSF